jgi:hypothetical protein
MCVRVEAAEQRVSEQEKKLDRPFAQQQEQSHQTIESQANEICEGVLTSVSSLKQKVDGLEAQIAALSQTKTILEEAIVDFPHRREWQLRICSLETKIASGSAEMSAKAESKSGSWDTDGPTRRSPARRADREAELGKDSCPVAAIAVVSDDSVFRIVTDSPCIPSQCEGGWNRTEGGSDVMALRE